MANMSLTKVPMPEQEPNVRNKNFEEVAMGYTPETVSYTHLDVYKRQAVRWILRLFRA